MKLNKLRVVDRIEEGFVRVLDILEAIRNDNSGHKPRALDT